jgi:hypothetical protein
MPAKKKSRSAAPAKAASSSVRLPQFTVHRALTPTGAFHVDGYVRDLALSPAGDVVAVVDLDGRLRLFNAQDGSELHRGALSNEPASSSAFSTDGQRIAVMSNVLVKGSTFNTALAVYDVASGARLTRIEIPGHGGTRPAFGSDASRVFFARGEHEKDNELVAVDVATGAVTNIEVPTRATTVSAVAVADARVFVVLLNPGERSGLHWFEERSLSPLGNVEWPSGASIVVGAHGAWAVGHEGWAWRVDYRAIESGNAVAPRGERARWAAAEKVRKARRRELMSRAKSANDRVYLAQTGELDDLRVTYHFYMGCKVEPHPQAKPGVRSHRHLEPWAIEEGIGLGDDVIVRDPARVALWRERLSGGNAGGLDVIPLVEDMSRASRTARIQFIAGPTRDDVIAFGWRKSVMTGAIEVALMKIDRSELEAVR